MIKSEDEYNLLYGLVLEGLEYPPQAGTLEAATLVRIMKAVSDAKDQFSQSIPHHGYEISGLTCECGFSIEDLPVDDYKKYVNQHCPQCGSNILTQDDYGVILLMKYFSESKNETLSTSQ